LHKFSKMYISGEKSGIACSILVLSLLPLLLGTGCATYKNTTYFRDIPDSLKKEAIIDLAAYDQPRIQPGDLLYISIQTLDPQSSNPITGSTSNAAYVTQATSTLTPGSSTAPTYLIDRNGKIELPLVGIAKLSGLTTSEARDTIRNRASLYYKNPVVNVRFANFNITVLGEVNRPAQYTVPSERVTILDAIGMAGDLTIYGKRENVLLVREENGQKKAVRFNLNATELMSSPYFYLKQNDVVYVEPTKARAAANDAVRDRNLTYLITISTSIISIAIIALTRF